MRLAILIASLMAYTRQVFYLLYMDGVQILELLSGVSLAEYPLSPHSINAHYSGSVSLALERCGWSK